MSEIDRIQKLNVVIGETEAQADLVDSPIVGQKFSTSGMLLDPHEAIVESGKDGLFEGIPEDETDPKWLDEGKEAVE